MSPIILLCVDLTRGISFLFPFWKNDGVISSVNYGTQVRCGIIIISVNLPSDDLPYYRSKLYGLN